MKQAGEGILPGFQSQDRLPKKSKTEASEVPQKGLMSAKCFFLKKKRFQALHLLVGQTSSYSAKMLHGESYYVIGSIQRE